MLMSLALIFLLGISLGFVAKKCKLPSLIGMILAGIILGPYTTNLIDLSILNISTEIRLVALVIILTRAGLSLNLKELRMIGRPAILMCFLPACFEILGVMIIAPILFHITLLDAALMGSVLAAVSPAVIVPRMIKMIHEGYGVKKGIPQMILAGASIDDIFVIVLFTALLAFTQDGGGSVVSFIQVPISILTGFFVGILLGIIFIYFFRIVYMKNIWKVCLMLSSSLLLLVLEISLKEIIPFSALIAIMCIGVVISQKNKVLANSLEKQYHTLWKGAEILLFVLVGATLNISFISHIGVTSIVILLIAMMFRMMGVFICVTNTKLNQKERLFSMIAYTPKATVQAAIGSIPLTMGLSSGKMILAISILSILSSAPLGALAIDVTYKRWLTKTV